MTRDGGMNLGLSGAWLRYPGAADWAMRDVTLEFYLGASRALEILQGSGASVALLLAGSPSCDREFGIFGKEAAKLVPVVRCKRDLVGWESQARFYLHLPPPHRTFPQ